MWWRDSLRYSAGCGWDWTEFKRVLVVLDGEERNHFQFSCEKLFGLKDLSKRDMENVDSGAENVLSRTRRLLYVCCSRARRGLAVVLYTGAFMELLDVREHRAPSRLRVFTYWRATHVAPLVTEWLRPFVLEVWHTGAIEDGVVRTTLAARQLQLEQLRPLVVHLVASLSSSVKGISDEEPDNGAEC